jgi:radical SAM protein with 4Fe4S-binding SPASM domain
MIMTRQQPIHTQDTYALKKAAKEFPMMVVLSFVYVCNAGCPNCPYNNSDIRSHYKDALFMPEALFKKIAEECGTFGSMLPISGGGEPMLHPKAVDLMAFARSKGAKIGLITNGSKFTYEHLTKLIGIGIDALEFSVDAGDEKTYRKVRPGLDWYRLNRTVEKAREIRDRIGSGTKIITSIINQEDVDVDAAERHWASIADKVQIRKFLTWGYNNDHSADPSPYLPPEQNIPCPWLFERLNVDSRGDVTLCGEDIAFKEKFANVMDQTIRDIWLGPEFTSFRERHLRGEGNQIPICRTCPDRQYRSWQYNYWKVLKDAGQKAGQIGPDSPGL